MKELSDIARTLADMPAGVLGAVVVLGAFSLAAYAIYAILTVIKTRH